MRKSFLFTMATSMAAAFPATPEVPDFGEIELLDVKASEFSTEGIKARGWIGPAFDQGFPDPTLLKDDDDVWWAYSTSNNGHIPLATSDDGMSWKYANVDAMPDVGPWIDPKDRGIWAPSVFKNSDGEYIMYFAGKKNGGRRCAGVARSTSPQGPFNVTDSPLICDDEGGGVIDPVHFNDGSQNWIIWKVDGNALGGATSCTGGEKSDEYKPTWIKIQRVSKDGLSLEGDATNIYNNAGKADDGVVEGPAMYKRRPGSYVLFFSTHCYSNDKYDIQYVWGTAPNGKFQHRKTLAKTDASQSIYGPGHMDIAKDGQTIAFHARDLPNNQKGTTRRMYIGKIKLPEGDYSDGIEVVS